MPCGCAGAGVVGIRTGCAAGGRLCQPPFFPRIREEWRTSGHPNHVAAADPVLFTTRAAATARLAALHYPDGVSGSPGEPGDPFLIEPRYLRASQAEQRRYDLAPPGAGDKERS